MATGVYHNCDTLGALGSFPSTWGLNLRGLALTEARARLREPDSLRLLNNRKISIFSDRRPSGRPFSG
jgi:hypothetical protein